MTIAPCAAPRSIGSALVAALLLAVPLLAEAPRAAPGAQLATLAESGRFDDVLVLLRNGALGHDEAGVTGLIGEIERLRSHRQVWATERSAAFDIACAEMGALAADDHLEDALGFAIEAHGLAQDNPTFLDDPRVVGLVGAASDRAAQAEADGDWVEAINFYRRLDLLFNDPGSEHRERFRRAADHLRVMRIYIPDRLKALYGQRAAARGEPTDPINLGDATWQQRLERIDNGMLFAALRAAQQRHINRRGYRPLLRGALEALVTLMNTRGLDAVFPSLRNPHAAEPMRAYLAARIADLDGDDSELTWYECRRVISRLFTHNRATIDLPVAVLVYEMTEGALGTLDEFTSVIWPFDNEQFRRNTRGRFYGVGIQISMSPGPLTIVEIDAGSGDDPAHSAGIRNGDVIENVNGRDVSTYSPGYVMWKIRSAGAGGVQLALHRPGRADPVHVSMASAIDLKIKRPNGRLTVKSPLRGTPAYHAGIRAEDVIATVDGQDTRDWTLDQAVRNITGPLNTSVLLGIERKGDIEVKPCVIRRAEIEIESIKGWRLTEQDTWDYYIDHEHKVGYVRLMQFLPQTSDDLDRAVASMTEDAGLEALILDLRFNPGGLLNKAVDVADRFINSGTIVSTVDADGTEMDKRSATPHRTYQPIPVVVLINQTSASASEIVSGALQAYGRGTIVGTRSFGKGSVQDLFPIAGGPANLKLTTQYYRLPNKRIIHRTPTSTTWGIEPDLHVDVTDDQVRELLSFRQEADVLRSGQAGPTDEYDADRILQEGLDPQLQAALLVLRTKLLATKVELASRSADP